MNRFLTPEFSKVKSKWGYVDNNGRIIINPIFDYASGFNKGVALVKIYGSPKYIDKTGKLYEEPPYGKVEDSSQILIPQELIREGVNWGFVSETRQFVIAPQFERVLSFSEGVAAVKRWNYQWGFIDENGEYVIEPQFDSAKCFSEGLAAVMIAEHTKWGLRNCRWGFIDKMGKYVIEPRFDESEFTRCPFCFNEGLAVVSEFSNEERRSKTGFIDKSGKYVIGPSFIEARPFIGGLAQVLNTNGKWGVINKTGQFVIEPIFDAIMPSQKAFKVNINGSWHEIDKTGKFM